MAEEDAAKKKEKPMTFASKTKIYFILTYHRTQPASYCIGQ
jgi:hypothetical protein